jgi:hypothetical protein
VIFGRDLGKKKVRKICPTKTKMINGNIIIIAKNAISLKKKLPL